MKHLQVAQIAVVYYGGIVTGQKQRQATRGKEISFNPKNLASK